MKTIVISAKTVSGIVGLVLCYAISLYFFWNSQAAFSDFFVNPENSYFTKLLHTMFGYGSNQGYPNKTVGVIAAFLSIHVSWHLRYKAGRWVEILIQRFFAKSPSHHASDVGISSVFFEDLKSEKLENNKNNIKQIEMKSNEEVLKK